MLHQKYGLQQSQLIYRDKDSQLRDALNEQKAFLHGHFSYQLIDLLQDHNYFTATLLRDPVERVISRYVHLAFAEDANLVAERESYKNFEDYLKSYYARNWQCQVLCGNMHSKADSKGTLNGALHNLYNLDWVGVSEKLNEGMLDLSLKLGFENSYYPHLNKRKSDQLWKDLYKDYAEDIAEQNANDQKLYAAAKKIYLKNKKIPSSAIIRMKLKEVFGPSQPKLKA
jgi:hypothetical protein